MFSRGNFVECSTNQVKLSTPKHVFDVILRYLYDQDPYIGISEFISDIILEASYFELNDFEQKLWEIFKQEADVTNCIKAITLTTSNPLFELRKPIVME